MRQKVSKNIVFLLMIIFINGMGTNIFSYMTTFEMMSRTSSSWLLGLLMVISPISSLVLNPIYSLLLDKVRYDQLIKAIYLIQSIAFLIFYLSYGAVWHIFVVYALVVSLGMLHSLVISASGISAVGQEGLYAYNSYNQSLNAITLLTSPFLGSFFYTRFSYRFVGLILMILGVIALFLAYLVNFYQYADSEQATDDGEEELSAVQTLKAGCRYVRQDTFIMGLILLTVFFNFFLTSLNIGLPYMLLEVLGLSEFQYSITSAASGAGMLLMAYFMRQFSEHFEKTPIHQYFYRFGGIFLLIAGVFFLLQWFEATVIATLIFVVIELLYASGMTSISVTVQTAMQSSIPQHYQGRVFTLNHTLGQILMPIGSLIFGAVFEVIHPTIIYGIVGISFLLIIRQVTHFITQRS